MLQELRSGQPLAVAQLYHFGNVGYDINHLHLFIEFQPLLRVIAETDGLADFQLAAVRFLFPHQNLDEGRLTGTVVSHDTHLLVTGEDVGEIIQDLQVAETLVQMVCLKNL